MGIVLKGAWSGTWMGPRPIKTPVPGCIYEVQKGGIASSLGFTPQYSRPKYIPLRLM
jgi:hypothetical protein